MTVIVGMVAQVLSGLVKMARIAKIISNMLADIIQLLKKINDRRSNY